METIQGITSELKDCVSGRFSDDGSLLGDDILEDLDSLLTTPQKKGRGSSEATGLAFFSPSNFKFVAGMKVGKWSSDPNSPYTPHRISKKSSPALTRAPHSAPERTSSRRRVAPLPPRSTTRTTRRTTEESWSIYPDNNDETIPHSPPETTRRRYIRTRGPLRRSPPTPPDSSSANESSIESPPSPSISTRMVQSSPTSPPWSMTTHAADRNDIEPTELYSHDASSSMSRQSRDRASTDSDTPDSDQELQNIGGATSAGIYNPIAPIRRLEGRQQEKREFFLTLRVLERYLDRKDPALLEQVRSVVQECQSGGELHNRYGSFEFTVRQVLLEIVPAAVWVKVKQIIRRGLLARLEKNDGRHRRTPRRLRSVAHRQATPGVERSVSYSLLNMTLQSPLINSRLGASQSPTRDRTMLPSPASMARSPPSRFQLWRQSEMTPPHSRTAASSVSTPPSPRTPSPRTPSPASTPSQSPSSLLTPSSASTGRLTRSMTSSARRVRFQL